MIAEVLGAGAERGENMDNIDLTVLGCYLSDWTRFPYALFRRGATRLVDNAAYKPLSSQIDEWSDFSILDLSTAFRNINDQDP